MRIEPEISGVQIVVLGDFNPAIFSPAWFAHHGLLRPTMADNATVGVIHPEASDFVADWLQLRVTKERFQAGTLHAPYVRLRDLVVRVLGDHLRHTPVRAFGINRDVHFLVGSPSDRDRLGTALVPLTPWGPWRERLDLDSPRGGMTSVRVSQLEPQDGRHRGGQVNIIVEPSVRVGQQGTGVYVRVNDHYTTETGGADSAQRLMEVLSTKFNGSIRMSEEIIDHIMSISEVG